ncbi:MAG: hypothetical protein WD075_08840 [Rhodospirillales bacterium]
MTEIAAIIAILVALGAIWLASHANKQVDSTFDEFGRHLAKQVRDAQVAFSAKTEEVQTNLKNVEREVEALQAHNRDLAEKINTLSLRMKVVEHDLKSLTEAIPPQILQRKRSGNSA